MNERIKLLIEQATTYIDPIANDGVCWDFKVTTCWDFDKEKFAQLIVAECAKLNKKQSYELSGVIADTEEFGGFDLVCLDTVKRVEQYLASDTLINHFNKKDDIL